GTADTEVAERGIDLIHRARHEKRGYDRGCESQAHDVWPQELEGNQRNKRQTLQWIPDESNGREVRIPAEEHALGDADPIQAVAGTSCASALTAAIDIISQ